MKILVTLVLAAVLGWLPAASAQSLHDGDSPPLAALVDSAALVRAAAALSAPAPPQGIPPIFRVSFDTTGAAKEVVPVFDQIPASYAGPVAAAIRALLRPQAPSRRPISTHLRVVAGPEARVDRPLLRERAPEVADPEKAASLLREVVESRRGSWTRPRYQAVVQMLVLADGTVDLATVEVVHSTGDAELDRDAAGVAGRTRFRAATAEEIPVKALVQVPVRFDTELASDVRGFNSASLDAGLWVFGIARVDSASAEGDPPVPAVVDSAGLARAVAALPAPALPVRPLFRVTFDTAGAASEVEPLFDQIPASYAGPVAAAIRAHLKPQRPSRRPLRTHLRVEAGPEAAVDRPTLEERPPVLVNPDEVLRMLSQAGRRARVRQLLIPAFRLRVLGDGTVDPASIQVWRTSGLPELDRAAVRAAGQMRFRPAVVDGTPVKVWVHVSMMFRSSR